jgi:two-component system sensor histidine kinase TctE
VSVAQAAHQVIVAVQDSGQGIPAVDRERVFDRFYRVLGTKAEGSGLGLAIVREIATQHGASIHILDPFEQVSSERAMTQTGTRIEIRFEQMTR